jgi:hypothetical protein
MPYNSFYPVYNPYQPMQQYQQMLQPQVQPQAQTQQSSGGLLWVQGIEGAKSHFVEPGRSVLLMDSESNSFFIKSADVSGMPLPLRIFDYQERTAQQAPQQPTAAITDTNSYITREEFESRLAAITAVTERTDINAE